MRVLVADVNSQWEKEWWGGGGGPFHTVVTGWPLLNVVLDTKNLDDLPNLLNYMRRSLVFPSCLSVSNYLV